MNIMSDVTKKKWIILFGGTNREKIIFSLVESKKIKISAIIIPAKIRKDLKNSIDKIKKTKLKIIKSNKENLAENIKKYSGFAILSIGFPYILNTSIMALHKYKYNIHPTLLPKYKGPTSGAYILINKEIFTGSTVHKIEKKVDSGDIVAQNKIKVSKFDSLRSLQNKTYQKEPQLMLRALDQILKNKTFTKQKKITRYDYLSKRTPNDSEIDPKKSILDLYDEIRACDPEKFPAFFKLNNRKIYIKLSLSKKFIKKNNSI